MAVFKYEAIDAKGKETKGSLEADSARSVRNQLRMKGLTPLAVEPAEGTRKKSRPGQAKSVGWSFSEMSAGDVVLLTRQLASLLQARMALAQALGALVDQAEKPIVRDRLSHIRSEVVGGSTLSRALEQYPKAFQEMYIATVSAGESTGDLGGVLSRLADTLETRQALQQKVSAAFIYPAVVTFVALAVVIALLTYVVPQVVSVFQNSNQTLPPLTVAMIWISDLLRDWGWAMALVIGLAVWVFRRAMQSPPFKLRVDEAVLTLPIAGKFVRSVNTSRLASTLAILVSSGVPILKALTAANRTMTNSAMQLAMNEVQDRVKEGSGLSKALGKTGLFPPVLTHLVASGESTGQLAEMLQRASDSQRAEVERKTLWITSLLGPVLILVMGVIVMLIVMAVMMPIIEVNQLIQ